MAKARILVVDDDPAVLRLVGKVLHGAGYETVTAPWPRQALELVTIRGGFDVVVSDVVMPEMCGSELALDSRRIPFLGKPFEAKDLLCAVDRLLQPSTAAL